MTEFAGRWCSAVGGLMILASAAGFHAAAAQSSFNPAAQLWPNGGASPPPLAVFGSAVQCATLRCDPATSFGLDAALLKGVRAAIAGPRPARSYGLSYTWRHLDVATRIGGGTMVAQSAHPPSLIEAVRVYNDSTQGVRAETTYTSVGDSSRQDATRWSSAEARFTWREERWWATALVGRVAVAGSGAGAWGGLQIGAELGRGASLLLGMSTSPRLLAVAPLNSARSTVSLGFGFNAAIFSRSAGGAPPSPAARAAFVVSPISAGRIRITLRVPAAASVEFAADCTQWQPIAMTKVGDSWVADVPAVAGLHRANIRVDGGRWIAPPGLASVDDDFAGEVGIFVVQ